MNRFEQYMTDRSVENALSADEKEELTNNFLFGIASAKMEGTVYSQEDEDFLLYCTLNNVSNKDMLDIVFKVKGFPPLDHNQAQKNREEYEAYKLGLNDMHTNQQTDNQ